MPESAREIPKSRRQAEAVTAESATSSSQVRLSVAAGPVVTKWTSHTIAWSTLVLDG